MERAELLAILEQWIVWRDMVNGSVGSLVLRNMAAELAHELNP